MAYTRLLLSIIMISTLITGARSQCSRSFGYPLQASITRRRSIFSPDYPENYPDQVRCNWNISAYPAYVVHLHIVSIQLETSSTCSFDFITLFDGPFASSRQIAKICTDTVQDFYSSGSNMYVQFSSDFNTNDKGFHLEYSAVSASEVPSTTSTSAWWYTTSTNTFKGGYDWTTHINTAALIGGLTGGLLLLFIFCLLCRYYLTVTHARRAAPTYFSAHGQTAIAQPPTSTIYQNNNAVFMITGPNQHLPVHAQRYGGATNMAFSPCGEAPPAYVAALQSHSTAQVGSMTSYVASGYCPPPPTYTEAMMLSHPPAQAATVRFPQGLVSSLPPGLASPNLTEADAYPLGSVVSYLPPGSAPPLPSGPTPSHASGPTPTLVSGPTPTLSSGPVSVFQPRPVPLPLSFSSEPVPPFPPGAAPPYPPGPVSNLSPSGMIPPFSPAPLPSLSPAPSQPFQSVPIQQSP